MISIDENVIYTVWGGFILFMNLCRALNANATMKLVNYLLWWKSLVEV